MILSLHHSPSMVSGIAITNALSCVLAYRTPTTTIPDRVQPIRSSPQRYAVVPAPVRQNGMEEVRFRFQVRRRNQAERRATGVDISRCRRRGTSVEMAA